MTSLTPPLGFSDELSAIARRYGFSAASLSEPASRALSSMEAPERASVIARLSASMEAFSQVLSSACGLHIDFARAHCGLSGRLALQLADPTEMPGSGASFNPDLNRVRLQWSQPGAHFAHEWAHALDHVAHSLSGRPSAPASAPAAKLAARRASDRLLSALGDSPAPFHAAMAALAAHRLSLDSNSYLSSDVSAQSTRREARLPRRRALLPAFSKLVANLSRQPIVSIRERSYDRRYQEAASQIESIRDMARHAALESLSADALARSIIDPQPDPDQALRELADFCAQALVNRSRAEASRRRGREQAFDLAKSDIAARLGELGLPSASAALVAKRVFHIEPLKAIQRRLHGRDENFSLPYTGRTHWQAGEAAVGSFADLGCALVRVFRNQNALSAPSLSKESLIPLSYWWSKHRIASEISEQMSRQVSSMIVSCAQAGLLPVERARSTLSWKEDQPEIKAGAGAFFDLRSTGAKLIDDEARHHGSTLGESSAETLRSALAQPVDRLAARVAAREALAESFEQFILQESQRKSSLGKACQRALQLGLINSDPDELAPALSPELSWANGKDSGDLERSRMLWRDLLRALPQSLRDPSSARPSLFRAPRSRRFSAR